MKDVWEEARSELVPRCVPKSEPFKCKGADSASSINLNFVGGVFMRSRHRDAIDAAA